MTRSNSDRKRPRVAMFVTCMVDTLYPGVGMAAVELLERHGADVVFPENQTCCGQPAFNAGYRDEARRMARHFLVRENVPLRSLTRPAISRFTLNTWRSQTSSSFTTLFIRWTFSR